MLQPAKIANRLAGLVFCLMVPDVASSNHSESKSYQVLSRLASNTHAKHPDSASHIGLSVISYVSSCPCEALSLTLDQDQSWRLKSVGDDFVSCYRLDLCVLYVACLPIPAATRSPRPILPSAAVALSHTSKQFCRLFSVAQRSKLPPAHSPSSLDRQHRPYSIIRCL